MHACLDLTLMGKHAAPLLGSSVLHSTLLRLSAAVGGEERSQLVGGDVTAVDLDRLDPGAQYEVQVMALVQNREGTPVSVRITTREFCLSVFRHDFKVPTNFKILINLESA